jgi:hypothetical protein
MKEIPPNTDGSEDGRYEGRWRCLCLDVTITQRADDRGMVSILAADSTDESEVQGEASLAALHALRDTLDEAIKALHAETPTRY